MSMVDRDLAIHDADLASKVQVVAGLDVHLAKIDTAAGEDKHHVLQGLKDPTLGGDPKCYYFYQRWGQNRGADNRGQIEIEGPMLQPQVTSRIHRVFEELTGAPWGSIKPGDRALIGKYWLQQQAAPDLSAKWEYYVSDHVDGKQIGWYPYVPAGSDNVEELYAQHVANGCESRTATRRVTSGKFTYLVDLAKMTQQNLRTNKVRTIRRSSGDENVSVKALDRMALKTALDSSGADRVAPMKAMRKAPTRSMKVAAKSPVAKVAMKKVKKISKIGSKSQVLKGLKMKTKGGMKAVDLMKNKSGKVVSKKKHDAGKKAYEKNLLIWVTACSKARKELGLKGFVAVKKGSEFYNRTKALMSS